MEYLVWFKDIRKDSLALAGGKGANLGEMAHLGLPIPPGFVVTAQTYREFIERMKIKSKILSLLKDLDIEETEKLQKTAEEIQKLILKTEVPEDIAEAIQEGYEILGAEKGRAASLLKKPEIFVAVRSSATAEDLPGASFAGQQATFLNVQGKEKVVRAVRACWASLFTARAIYYRQKNNFPHEKVLIAVVIQKMVNSEKSGVMFTINPSTNAPDEIVIEAVYGLGEAIVSGEVNPNLYLVNKEDRSIKKIELKKQEWGLFRSLEGENEKKKIQPELQARQVLNDQEIQELARLGKKIEEHYHQPQDIEWAMEGNDILIVQSRAVTTFKPQEKEKERTLAKEEAGKILLRGETASAGVYSGKVKIVHNASELDKIEKGDILVTPMTNPDMVVAMQKAGAIITDEGGLTCIEGEAKLFTNKGFIKIREVGDLLTKNEELKTLSVDAKTKKVIWRKVLFSMKRKARTWEIAPYLHPTNQLRDKIKITPDHKMPFLEADQLKSLMLKDLVSRNYNLIIADRIPKGEERIDLGIFDKHKLMYLCGSIFSDGHIVKRKSGKPMRIMFSQKLTPEKQLYTDTVLSHFNSLFGAELKNYTAVGAQINYKGKVWERAGSFECSRTYPTQTFQTLKDSFVQVISRIEEEYLASFLGGLIDGDGHFNKEKSAVEIYLTSKDVWLIESTLIACLRLGVLPEIRIKKENLVLIRIKDEVGEITKKCLRVKAQEKKTEDRKLFDPKIFNSLKINDWRGNLYNYYKKNIFIGASWLLNYLKGHGNDNLISRIKTLADSDLRMRHLIIVGETEPIDVYNVTIEAPTEDDHNYIIFTKQYLPLLVYNCHAAIVSREMGIPCLVGTEHATSVLKEGEVVTVHATRGLVYEGAIEIKKEEARMPKEKAESIPLTATKIKVILDLPEKAEEVAQRFQPDGVGLVRLEFIIAAGGIHPAEYIRRNKEKEYTDLLVKNLRKIALAFKGKPVWVRCSDIRTDEYRNLTGGEKEPKETDPMLGWHGIRRLLDEPKILKAEFWAVKKLHQEGLRNIGLMLPFVIQAEEVKKAREILKEIGLEAEKIDFGVMIETPAACWEIEKLCREGISFISFGTNDLTQTTLGVDRNNERIQKLFDEMHPAVLGEIAKVIKVCKRYKVKTSICGQAASRPEMAEFLVHQGIDSLSVNPDAMEEIRRTVARTERKLLLERERKE